VGALPFRLLCHNYGADIVYSEEIIDKAVIQSKRVVNQALGTVDFVRTGSSDTKLWSTCPSERPVVFQLGTNNAVECLKAASMVAADVGAIDVNMGCPKYFSVHAGMGAALLNKPETVSDILKTLTRNLTIPITCKIRLKETTSQTIDFLKMVEQTGIKAVAVHCRTTPERPRDPGHWDRLKEITELNPIGIPIIGNGDAFFHEDIARMKQQTGVSSVMIARGACSNPSIFSKDVMNPPSLLDLMKEYTKLSVKYDNWYTNTKYVLMYMFKDNKAKRKKGSSRYSQQNQFSKKQCKNMSVIGAQGVLLRMGKAI